MNELLEDTKIKNNILLDRNFRSRKKLFELWEKIRPDSELHNEFMEVLNENLTIYWELVEQRRQIEGFEKRMSQSALDNSKPL